MTIRARQIHLLLLTALSASLCGCLNLKPAPATPHYFVLSPVPPEAGATARTNSEPTVTVGVGQVKLPGYLAKNSLAVRKGGNEIEYLEQALWAERLEQGFQSVLTADLSMRLPNKQVRPSAGRNADESIEVHVTVQEFDTQAEGKVSLAAWWRVLSAKGKIIKAGPFRASRPGPRPEADPQGATATMSRLVADLSDVVARAIEGAAPSKE